MNYLKQCTDRLLILINGYKTPQSVIDKLTKVEQRQYKPQTYTSNKKLIFGNPPYNGKTR